MLIATCWTPCQKPHPSRWSSYFWMTLYLLKIEKKWDRRADRPSEWLIKSRTRDLKRNNSSIFDPRIFHLYLFIGSKVLLPQTNSTSILSRCHNSHQLTHSLRSFGAQNGCTGSFLQFLSLCHLFISLSRSLYKKIMYIQLDRTGKWTACLYISPTCLENNSFI